MEISNFSLIEASTYALYVSIGFRTLVNFNTELMKIMGIYKIVEERIGNVETDSKYFLPFEKLEIRYLEEIKKIHEESAAIHEMKSSGVTVRI